jgi:hypothetical protein
VAAAGIPECWIVNLNNDVVEVCPEPSADGFARRTVFGAEETVPLRLSGKPIRETAVNRILP